MITIKSARRRTAFALSVAAVLGACVGSTGPAGPQGPPGETGATGVAGMNGANGTPGDRGPAGMNGANGMNGGPGPQGPSGDAGPPGRDLRFSAPGLVVVVLDAGVVDGGAFFELALTDSEGRGLDRAGTLTEGAVSVAFVAAALEVRAADQLPLHYVALTRRTVSVDGGTFSQAAFETTGQWTELDATTGRSHYAFSTPLVVDPSKTYALGLSASRTVRGTRAVANAVVHLRADGQQPTPRALVSDQACTGCHTRLEAHGGERRGVELCVVCHTDPAEVDPESGNSLDFKVMVHRLHRGASLPSVAAGAPYRFVGVNGQVSDFSQVKYPGSVNDCEACHSASDRWKTNPSQAACLSCHDRTWFGPFSPPTGWTAHAAGPRQDNQCIICHAEGSISAIPDRHPIAARDPRRLDVRATIVDAAPTPPGARPVVTFSATVNGQPRDVLTQRPSRLRFVFAGPNSDITRSTSEAAEAAPDCALLSDGGACLERVDAGVFRYRAATALGATDVGSFSVGVELCATNDAGTRWCAVNPVAPFAVTDTVATPRRADVTLARCEACHQRLTAHGGTRRSPEHCALCHAPTLVESVATPADGGAVFAPSANFKDLVHRVHARAAYPAPLNQCERCHTQDVSALPLPATRLPSRVEERRCVTPLPDGGPSAPADGGPTCLPTAVALTSSAVAPTSAACTSCHGSIAAQAHAALNTTAAGHEACAVCHGPARSSAVDVAHQVSP